MPTLRCKVVILGDPAVGKSALTQMFHSDGTHYPKNYVMTIGAEFCVKAVRIPDTQTTVELYLFDCAGQEIFRELLPLYLKDACLVGVVYDATSAETFESCKEWINLLNKHNPHNTKGIPGVLIANKTDLEERIEVKSHQGNEFAHTNNLVFFETSALRGKDIDAPFNCLAQQYNDIYNEKLKAFSKRG
eukprot:TRINITY_DN3456_c0_g1_i1.p1 TRINITY_DN3456_c0_g1~~TRINITY_DN3456_c0_g1_i1.p1  ORF type:complete len:189 (-),score=27.25 TRINITY_DN3456_c0_g1_i1:90-656(-)